MELEEAKKGWDIKTTLVVVIGGSMIGVTVIFLLLFILSPQTSPPPYTPPDYTPYYPPNQEFGEVRLNVYVNSPGYVNFYIDDEEVDWGYANSSGCYVLNYMGFIELEVGIHTFYARNIDGSTQIISYNVQENDRRLIYLGSIQ